LCEGKPYEELEHTFHKFLKYHKNTYLDVNSKVRREDILKPTIGNDSLHEINNDNPVIIANFVTSKNHTVKSTTFPHRNIHKFILTSPDGKTDK
jgi:hypothetical protein